MRKEKIYNINFPSSEGLNKEHTIKTKTSAAIDWTTTELHIKDIKVILYPGTLSKESCFFC